MTRKTIGVEPFTGGTAEGVAVDSVAGTGDVQLFKVVVGAEGAGRDVTDTDGLPVKATALPLPTGASTEATLAALKSAIDALSATVTALNAKVAACDTDNIAGVVLANTGLAQPLTDSQLRAAAVPVTTGLSQPLTDTQLRAAAVPVDTSLSQPLTDAQLRATAVPVNTSLAQPLTDAQLRATAVPVSTGLNQPLTDAQLRADPVPTTDAATQAIVQAIAEMSEGVQMALIALLDKTPLPTKSDAVRSACYGDDNAGTLLGSAWHVMGINATSNPNTGAQYYRTMEPWHFADMGAARLYSNIIVS